MKIKFKAKLKGKEVEEIADTDTIKNVMEHYISYLMEEDCIEEDYTDIEVIGFETSMYEMKDYTGGFGKLKVEI